MTHKKHAKALCAFYVIIKITMKYTPTSVTHLKSIFRSIIDFLKLPNTRHTEMVFVNKLCCEIGLTILNIPNSRRPLSQKYSILRNSKQLQLYQVDVTDYCSTWTPACFLFYSISMIFSLFSLSDCLWNQRPCPVPTSVTNYKSILIHIWPLVTAIVFIFLIPSLHCTSF